MKEWIVERCRPFDYIAKGSDGMSFKANGNEKDQILFMAETSKDAFELIQKEYPWIVPTDANGFTQYQEYNGDEGFYQINSKSKTHFVVFYPWMGETMFSNGIPTFQLLET